MESAGPALKTLGVDLSKTTVITRDQVQYAKPNPDLFLAAAQQLGVEIGASVVVGDSVWDLLAARRASALGVGLLSGGYGQDELEKAGAYRVYQDPADMMQHLDGGVRTAGSGSMRCWTIEQRTRSSGKGRRLRGYPPLSRSRLLRRLPERQPRRPVRAGEPPYRRGREWHCAWGWEPSSWKSRRRF
jgi:hypothetical protein